MAERIYITEDDDSIRELVTVALSAYSYEVESFVCAEDCLAATEKQVPDIFLFDIMLPGMDGVQAVKILRENEQTKNTPILMLTAKSAEIDKVFGLENGADDYLTKPFSTGELLARIRALTRRKGEVEVDCLHFGELQLNRQTYDLIQGDSRMKLSLKEYQIMEMLLSNPGQILPKERFIEKIWGYESDVEYNNIEVYISFLRKKLTAIHSTVQIRTARGIGYFLEKKA